MTIIAKDVGIVMDEARLMMYPAPLCSIAEQVFTAALGAGLAREDDGLITKLWELFGAKAIAEQGSIEEEEEKAKELDVQPAGQAKQVLFVGVGAMGSGMALSIQEAGMKVLGFDNVPQVLEAFVNAGGKQSPDPLTAAKEADVVVLMPVTTQQAEEILFGADGASGVCSGMSTTVSDETYISSAHGRHYRFDLDGRSFCCCRNSEQAERSFQRLPTRRRTGIWRSISRKVG